MKHEPSQTFVRDLNILYQVGTVGGLTDRELLGGFTIRDSMTTLQAFEAIVHRHGPMVLGVCRRVLGDEHTAEDAFQATFLVLALKADTIRKQNSLGPWLHGVATRISRRARVLSRRRGEQPLGARSLALCAREGDEIEAAELRSVLDEEVDRLPAAYRRAVVLCYFEGKTQEDAARELGWTKGTVSGRLARAKDLLRARLTRRGFAPSAGLLAAVLAGESTSVAVPASIANGATRTALSRVVLGRAEMIAVSDSAVALARGASRALLLGKVKTACAALFVMVAVATALAQTGHRSGVPGQDHHERIRSPVRSQPAEPAKASRLSEPSLPQYARARLGTTRLRHQGMVNSVAFAPDGRTLASAAWGGDVRFWDLATGEPANLPVLREVGGTGVAAYSPDGTKLAIGRDGVVQVWDLTTGKECARSPVHPGRVWEVAFAPDSRTLATTSDGDSRVRIWDVATGLQRRAFSFDVVALYSKPVAFSPDGKRIAVGGTAKTSGGEARRPDGDIIGIWDINGGDPLIIRKAHEGWLYGLTFTPEGTLISCGCAFQRPASPEAKSQPWAGISQIRVWDAISGRKLKDLDLDSTPGLCRLALSRDGKTLVSAHRDRLLAWELPAGKLIRTIPVEDQDDAVQYRGIAVSPEGRTIAAVRGDQAVHLWDVATGKPLFVQEHAHDTLVYSAAISPDGRLVATGDDRSTVRLWDPNRGEVLHQLGVGDRDRVWSVQFSPDGQMLAAASDLSSHPSAVDIPGVVRIWDLPGLQLRHELRVDHRAVLIEFSLDGRRLAVASWDLHRQTNQLVNGRRPANDDAITLFNVATGLKELSLPGHDKMIRAMTFGRDGKTLASAGQDNMFRLWDLATGRLRREIPIEGHRFAVPPAPGRTTWIGAAAFSSDLKTAVSSHPLDDRLLVWDLRAGRIRRTIRTGAYYPDALAVSPDGRFLASSMFPTRGHRDAPIRIWDMNTKREVLQLEPGVSRALCLSFSADRKTLVSGMWDTTALVWDISAAYEELKRPRD